MLQYNQTPRYQRRFADMSSMDPTPGGVTIKEILERLRVSRGFVTRNIAPAVTQVGTPATKGAMIYFDEASLSDWLRAHATFTRQTCRLPREKYDQIAPDRILPLNPLKRNQITIVKAENRDIWSIPLLIFPKEYHGNRDDIARITSPEVCYRDMYKAGAIKIQLGTQKTMFAVPNPHYDGISDKKMYLSDPLAIQQLADLPFDDPELPLVAAYSTISDPIRAAIVVPHRLRKETEQFNASTRPVCKITVEYPTNAYSQEDILEALQRSGIIKLISGETVQPLSTKKRNSIILEAKFLTPQEEEAQRDQADFEDLSKYCPKENKSTEDNTSEERDD